MITAVFSTERAIERYTLTHEMMVEIYSIIGDLKPENKTDLTIDQIKATVCDFFKVPVYKMSQKTRKREIVKARQIIMYFANELTRLSLKFIGNEFNRDHTTVMHSCKTVRDLMETDEEYRKDVFAIKELLQAK